MRRMALAAVLTVAMVSSTSANAAPGQVFHERYRGSSASAGWHRSSDTFDADTMIDVSTTKQGQELFLLQFIEHYDTRGNFTGATTIYGYATSGFSFAIDAARFSSASVSGSGLPAKRCSYDENFRVIGCTRVTFGVEVTWTGHGMVFHGTIHDHTEEDGIKYRFHWTGHSREADASATFSGLAAPLGPMDSAAIGKVNSGATTICVGLSC